MAPTTSPIGMLPRELLQSVFLLVQASSMSDGRGQPFHRDYAWMGVSHVCAYWRDAAASHGALWSNLDLGTRAGDRLAELFLARCPPRLPLAVFVRHDSRRLFAWALGATHRLALSRARAVDVQNRAWPGLPLPLQQPAGRLRALRVHAADAQVPVEVPADLLGRSAPALEELELAGCALDWRTLLAFPALARLSVRRYQSRNPSVSLFAVLQALPALRELVIDLPVNMTQLAQDPENHVVLTCLAELRVGVAPDRTNIVADLRALVGYCGTPRLASFCVDFGAGRLVQEEGSTWLLDVVQKADRDAALLDLVVPQPCCASVPAQALVVTQLESHTDAR
jgi:hypothetical protein